MKKKKKKNGLQQRVWLGVSLTLLLTYLLTYKQKTRDKRDKGQKSQ